MGPQSSTEWVELRVRVAQTRSHLAGLCEQIAALEDSLGDTLTDLAETAAEDRAERLRTLASAAHSYAVKERARAKLYEAPPLSRHGDEADDT